MIAKSHLALKDRTAAKQWLGKALELHEKTPDDAEAVAEARKLLLTL